MTNCRKLLVISVPFLFLLIQITVQDCVKMLYRTKANSTCKTFNGYTRSCAEFYQQNFYELQCAYVDNINNSMPSDYFKDVYSISIVSTILDIESEIFKYYTNVKSIKLQYNNIRNITTHAFSNLPNLESLKLIDNVYIDVIFKRFFYPNDKLESLDLSGNLVRVVEDDFMEGFGNLKTLLLGNNNILDASSLLKNCGNLSSLILSKNIIERIEFTTGCSQLKTLSLDNNHIREFNVKIQEESALEYLNLSRNNIGHIGVDSLKHFTAIKQLDLSDNPLFKVSDLPTNLFQNKLELQYLNLSRTGIQNIVLETFSKLNALEVLDLSYNELTYLQKGIFHDLIKIRKIYLNNNYLTVFEYGEYKRGPTTIDLNNNLWDCDTLTVISMDLQEKLVSLQHGPIRDLSNVHGISCDENAKTKSRQRNIQTKSTFDDNQERLDLLQILAQQENVLNISKSLLEYIKKDMERVNNSDGNYRSITIGIYFILFMLSAGLILLLIILFKRYKIVKTSQEELRNLNNFVQ